MELVKISAAQFGVSDETAKNIQNQFQPMLDKMVELEGQFNEIMALPKEDTETCKKAKALRLKFVKVRTGTAEIHKQQKDFYLKGGKFVDGWKNAQLFASQGKEKALEEIENFFENIAKAKIQEIQDHRANILTTVAEYTGEIPNTLGAMEEDVWEAYISAKIQANRDKKEAEAKAKEARELKAKADAEEKDRIKKELEESKSQLEQAMAELKKVKSSVVPETAEEIETRRAAALKKLKDEIAALPIKAQLTAWVSSFYVPLSTVDHPAKHLILNKFEAFKAWAMGQVNLIE